jgi:hypothetical protein
MPMAVRHAWALPRRLLTRETTSERLEARRLGLAPSRVLVTPS